MSELNDSEAAIGRALVELGGRARPGDVGRSAGLASATQSRAIRRLAARDLVTASKAEVALTPAGWDLFVQRPRPDAGDLDDALAIWPYRHRAFLELLLSTIVARWHLAGARSEPYLGFMAVGATNTGKSAMADFACHLLGLDAVAHTLCVPEQTEGSIGGRREQGGAGWRFSPAPAMALPFVLFDEYDKADDATRKSVLPYFQGRVAVNREGSAVTFRPTPMLAANPPRSGDRYSQLRLEYRRRSIVLDAGTTRDEVAHLEETLIEFYADPRWHGVVSLEDIRPASELTDSVRRALLGTLPNLLTDDGRELFCGARALELTALGRAALLGASDPIVATLATVHDYLACFESVPNLVAADWHLALEDMRSTLVDRGIVDASEISASLERRRETEEAAQRRATARRRNEQADDLTLVGARA